MENPTSITIRHVTCNGRRILIENGRCTCQYPSDCPLGKIGKIGKTGGCSAKELEAKNNLFLSAIHEYLTCHYHNTPHFLRAVTYKIDWVTGIYPAITVMKIFDMSQVSTTIWIQPAEVKPTSYFHIINKDTHALRYILTTTIDMNHPNSLEDIIKAIEYL